MTISRKDRRFSVVVPVFNKERFVRAALLSVLGQSYRPFEIIVVDDGSVDGSVAAIADLVSGSVRVVTQTNAGPGAARNRGVAEAGGDWVAFLDADDLWLDNHLATLSELTDAFPAAKIVSTAFERVPLGSAVRPTTVRETLGYTLNFFSEQALREAVWTSSVGVRRRAFLSIGGFKNIMPGEDTELWIRLALNHPMACTRKVTALYTVGTDGLMDQHARGDRSSHTLLGGPVFATLDRALADPHYSRMHDDIQRFRESLIVRKAKHALFAGDPRRARAALALLTLPRSARERGYRILAALPGPVLRRAIGTASRLKNWSRRNIHKPSITR